MNYVECVVLIATVIGIGKCETIEPDCSSEKCICETGYVLNSNNTNCLPYVTEYYGYCSEDSQCEWLGENSECHHVCMCKEGYHWYLGQCRQYVGLGETCSDTVDCFDGYNFEALTCTNGKCGCNDGYYERENTDCRKKATALNDICALDIDCHVPDTVTICRLGKCNLPDHDTTEEEKTEAEEFAFIKKAVAEVKTCQSNDDCSQIENSECYVKTGTCVCKKSYFFSDDGTKCIGEVGVNVDCESDSDCPIKPGKCVDGVCLCRDYYFVAEGNRKCVKTISQNNWNCLSNEWCLALGSYGYCNSTGTCTCSQISDLDADNMLCRPNNITPDPDMCRTDIECKDRIINSVCIDEKCQIVTVPELGEKCTVGGLACKQDHSDCLENICQCVKDYVEYDKTCYPVRYTLHESCQNDDQCSAGVTYSKCDSGKCVCNKNRNEYNDTCYQTTEFGSYCNNRLECSLSLGEMFGNDIQCRNRKCQCRTGSIRKENKCSSGTIITGNIIIMVSTVMLKGVFSVFS